jgi:hypothetical protein
LRWKSDHIQRVQGLFDVGCDSRADARAKIESILETNEQIHKLYGPDREYRFNPEAEEADVWKRKVISQVIPNNYRILNIVDANRKFLSYEERVTLEALRQHVDDLTARHLGDRSSVGRRFPEDARDLLS